jgi:DNA-binding winged helix-turn-helix (wHTH) protein/Tol biopolymer transport system component
VSNPSQKSRKIRFAEFELDLETAELRRNGHTSIVPGQPFKVLLTLLNRPGQLVTRNELKSRLWPSDTFVDFDQSLNKAVKRLRESLNDPAEHPRFIETLPRRGYRFIGTVDRSNLEGQIVQAKPRKVALVTVTIASTIAVALACLVWFTRQPSVPAPQLKIRQLTTNSDENPVRNGSISPDGRYLAYADPKKLYIKSIETGETRVVAEPEELQNKKITWVVIAWFPDGLRFLVNAHPAGTGGEEWNSESTSIWTVSATDGPPRKLRDTGRSYAISPDGSLIAFGMSKGRFGEREVWLMDSNGEKARKIIESSDESAVDMFLWSSDGQRVSYIVHNEDRSAFRIMTRAWRNKFSNNSREDASTKVLPLGLQDIFDRIELPGGRVILSVEESGTVNKTCNLWTLRVDALSGDLIDKPRQLTHWGGYCMTHMSTTRDGKRLSFMRWRYGTSVYLAELERNGTLVGSPRHLTLTESLDYPVGWTCDGKTVVFASTRAGHWGLYKQFLNQDTAELLAAGLDDMRSPQMSPDNKWILYALPVRPAESSSERSVMRVPVTGGPAQPILTARPHSEILCASLPSTLCLIAEPTEDRRHLIMTSFDVFAGRRAEVTRFELDPMDDRWTVALSTDGTRLAVTRHPDGPIFILSLRGQPTQTINIKDRKGLLWCRWAVDGKGLYVSSEAQGGAELLYVDFHGNWVPLWKNRAGNYTRGLPSPDGHHLAIMGLAFDGNVWMMDNF